MNFNNGAPLAVDAIQIIELFTALCSFAQS
jgi:hypothetical protein